MAPARRLTLCASAVATVPLPGFLCEPWVAVVWAAWLVVSGLHIVLSEARFLAALPIPRQRLLAVVSADPKQYGQAFEDIFWAILNSKEFLFNH